MTGYFQLTQCSYITNISANVFFIIIYIFFHSVEISGNVCFSCLLLRCASQNSLDESSQKHISQSHPHTKERPPYKNHLHTQKAFDVMNSMRK